MNNDPHYLGYLDEHDPEADKKNKESISNVQATKGIAKYKLPWYRRLIIKLFGKSHFW